MSLSEKFKLVVRHCFVVFAVRGIKPSHVM